MELYLCIWIAKLLNQNYANSIFLKNKRNFILLFFIYFKILTSMGYKITFSFIKQCIIIKTNPWMYFQIHSHFFNSKKWIFSKIDIEKHIPKKWRLESLEIFHHTTAQDILKNTWLSTILKTWMGSECKWYFIYQRQKTTLQISTTCKSEWCWLFSTTCQSI